MRRPGIILCFLLTLQTTVLAQSGPRFSEIVGHSFGERISLHREMETYVQRLAELSPRVKLILQGRTWEWRNQYAVIITSPENQQRLEAIRQGIAALADPRRTDAARAEELIRTLPLVAFLGGSIHGFELSGSEAMLKLIEHLSTDESSETQSLLQNLVVIIDPMLNPDGRDAFAHYNHQALGSRINPSREDWNNRFLRWEALKFRTNHYFFDLNRDWFAHTQIETRNRIRTILQWHPQIVIDAHEMGSDFEFYFDPATQPDHVYYPQYARRWLSRFGRAYAAAFDSAGYEFMTRERYNYYYPGYTTSWSSYQGAAGMLFEQGSSRGLAILRPDQSVRTLEESMNHHYLGALTALRFAARNRRDILKDYYQAHVQAVADGKQGIRRYLFPPEGDAGLIAEAVDLLRRNAIEVHVLTEAIVLTQVRDREGRHVGRREFPAGTYVIEAAQPRNRLIRTLLEPDAPLPKKFLNEARARADRGENPRFYDITAWSLPLLFNVPAFSTSDGRPLPVKPVDQTPNVYLDFPREGYAYILDGRQAATMAALYHLAARGYRVAMTLKETRILGQTFASGSGVIRTGDNPEDVYKAVKDIAQKLRIRVTTVATGLSDVGFPALGSEWVRPLKKVEIALVAEHPIHGYSFGYAWFTLDRQYDIPVTVLRAWALPTTPLKSFHTIVLPHMNRNQFKNIIGKSGMARLVRWVKDGGVLVAIGDAGLFVAKDLKLAKIKSWADTTDNPAAKDQLPMLTPGAFLRTELLADHWLTAGYSTEFPALVYSNRILLPPDGLQLLPQRKVVGKFTAADRLRISGHIWPDVARRMENAVFLYEEKHERGRVILFAEDPNFRGYWRGADRLFLNAVLFAPAAP